MCREFYSNLDTRWNRSLYEKCMKIANEESTGLGFRNWRERQKRVKNSSEIWSSVTYTVLNSWKSSRFPFACQTVFHLGFTLWLVDFGSEICLEGSVCFVLEIHFERQLWKIRTLLSTSEEQILLNLLHFMPRSFSSPGAEGKRGAGVFCFSLWHRCYWSIERKVVM